MFWNNYCLRGATEV